ncbi:MAG: DUF445 domain-containing protein [Ornithinimicrobium sp.]
MRHGPDVWISDDVRAADLRTMRLVATGLLGLAALVFAVTLGQGGVLGYVHAGAEAAMVGAIADWFAVTAIFRHPLGIPIPHTALVPRRKDTLAQGLEQFVTEHFLSPQTLRERYLDADVVSRVGHWLSDPEHSERVVAEVAPWAQTMLRGISRADARALAQDTLIPRLRTEPISPLAGHLLEAVVRDRAHHGVVEIAARELHTWLLDHPDDVARMISSRAPTWSPAWVDQRVVRRVYAEVLSWAGEVKDDPKHRVRQAIDSYLASVAQDLQHDPDTMARAEAFKTHVLEHPQVADTAVELWEAIRTALDDALGDAPGPLRTRLADELASFGRRLTTDDVLQNRLDAWAADAVLAVVEQYGIEVTGVITATIKRWDGQLAARRIELHVGRDLQFIRINGTIVGALVGLSLHAITQLLS